MAGESQAIRFVTMRILLISVLLSVCSASSKVVSSVDELPYDENGRLSTHVLVYPDGRCANLIENHYATELPIYGYEFMAVTGKAHNSYFGGEGEGVLRSPPLSMDDCRAICLERGVEKAYVTAAMPSKHYYGREPFRHWFRNSCQQVEVGFMNYAVKGIEVKVYWLSPDGTWNYQVSIKEYGNEGVLCLDSFLGHVFKFENSVTGEEMLQYRVEYNAMVSIGEAPPYTIGDTSNFTARIKDTLENEWTRHNRITRTFSSLGFRKGRLPDDLFANMGAFHYNNYHNKVREEWSGRGLFVNWWEYDVLFIQIPGNLKKTWAQRMQHLVEYWVGVELEETSMYGLRRYEEGARLLTHVDRHETHAASLIVNIAQGNLEEPWTVEVHDHADRLHQVVMEPGDVVYYESARCLHGRNTPLKGKGSYYVNMFAHYRPIGDEFWFEKPNPDWTPEPLLDVGECVLDGPAVVGKGKVKCDNKAIGEDLSPSMFTATSGEDLFQWWKKVGPPQTDEEADQQPPVEPLCTDEL